MKKFIISTLLSTLILIVFTFSLDISDFNSYGWAFFIIQLLVILLSLNKVSKEAFIYLSPSVLALVYLNLSLGFGHWAVANDISYQSIYADEYLTFGSPQIITAYLLLCSMVVSFSLVNFLKNPPNYNPEFLKNRKISKPSEIYVALIGVLLLSLIEFDLSLIGGVGNFNYPLQLALTIVITIKLMPVKKLWRYITYLILTLVFLISNYNSKREILFVVILFLFFELIRAKFKFRFNVRNAILGLILGGAFLIFIIISSIARGYGNFNVDNPLQAVEYIDDYITADYFQSSVVGNLEIITVYGNTANAINYTYEGDWELGYGSTFAKTLFIPIPRIIFPNKPKSMIDIYTTKFQPSFRDRSGSLPVTIYGEVFYNFNLFGLFFLYIIFYFLNRLYGSIITRLSTGRGFSITFYMGLFFYVTLIQFVRGSGLDLWVVYTIVSSIIFIPYFIFSKKNNSIENTYNHQ